MSESRVVSLLVEVVVPDPEPVGFVRDYFDGIFGPDDNVLAFTVQSRREWLPVERDAWVYVARDA